MRTIVTPLPHDLAVVAALVTTGKPVGYGEAPPGALDGVLNRTGSDYFVVHRTSGGRDGTLNDPYADARLVYQVNAVARMQQGAAYLLGLVEPALLGATIAGRVVTQVEPLAEQGPQPDRDVGPPHPFWAWSQFRLWTVPA